MLALTIVQLMMANGIDKNLSVLSSIRGMVKWVTLPNGVIHYNMSLSTTNILIVSVSFSYCSPIVLLLFSYCSPIVLLSFSYCSPIVLLLFSYWGSGNNTETIRKQYGIERRMNEERSKDERRMNEERYCRIVGRTAMQFHC